MRLEINNKDLKTTKGVSILEKMQQIHILKLTIKTVDGDVYVYPHALCEVEGYALDDCLAVGDSKWTSQTLFEIQEINTITIETSF